MPAGRIPAGYCQRCAKAILHLPGHRLVGQVNVKRRWHPECVRFHEIANHSAAQRSALRQAGQTHCALCREKVQFHAWPTDRLAADADHIVPLWSVAGGVTMANRGCFFSLVNLWTLCHGCHLAKSAREAKARAKLRAAEKKGAEARRQPGLPI